MRLAVTLALAACSAPPAPPLASRVTSSGTRSCALAEPIRSPAKMTLRRWLGRIGERSWVMVLRDDKFALAGLDAKGKLALVELPANRRDHIETAIDGSRLWLMVGKPGLDVGEEVLYVVDLAGTPQIQRVETLAAKTIAGANSFAVGPTRALFFTFAAYGGYQLWDRSKHAPLVTEAGKVIGVDPPVTRCVLARCFAVDVVGDGPGRRLTAVRFTDTKIERQELAGDHLAQHLIVPADDRTIVLWDSYSRPGAYARTLDAEGRPIDGEVTLVATFARDMQALPGGHLVYRSDTDWMLAQLSPDFRTVKRTVPLGAPKANWIETAKTTDGVFAVAFNTSVSYHGEFIRPTMAEAVFVPDGDAPEPPIDVMGSEKRYSFTAFPLIASGYAAALVISQNEDPDHGELVLLRTPCGR